MFSIFDSQMMLRAIELAERGIYTTAPNPNVGCVITQGDDIIGEGFHFRAGEPHAEVHALRAAGGNTKNATAYVTLEPCSHYGRTPPCADALINAGVSRVVCTMVDPNPKVAGRGIQRLRDAGIQVDVGLMQTQAEALNPGFIKVMKTGLPYVQLKLAASIDGRTALANGQSKWITGAEARADVQRFRAQTGAILSTSQTVIDDNPSLNVRWAQLPEDVQCEYDQTRLRQPVRVILDTTGKVSSDAGLFSLEGNVVVLTANKDLGYIHENVEVILVPKAQHGLDLNAALRLLASKGINHIWVETGATLAGGLLAAELVDELIVYQAPKLMGADSRALVNLTGLTSMNNVPTFELTDVCQIGNDVRLRMQKQ
ncbi:bifunctional diaminohydroxyphosphoribosylaminopyrimidine deaminase/5-amino-6-(5-phosphoribosylamino)uracil reductase RibD [Enterovibrio nigricans]|uniref:Riboflavin biosynthesis protein RibD n=1 Tax=Enterovibrio nigricans DSM 22720 TaxID=1121868 RepID=A0A1T4U2S1_9GAMM|nr:bifunctional diaminohydroxyphosphoribosylaminopyrimidine deaminase/5-amino-6-(5-phosphoribosylamino)uracil reductase RibD [Enterovibrio nigricans]PKF51799.1 bifunctional diaminohydroxyphosphoribosylaminopyrimidine deaminase/5-amino-6-(5-phosphoribosylamino)uracil reductase RibD [Enterovibrio nigricans]SKA47055.1 diaminohydroxyphosphoribosylaminopyrimidine deaminase [Enterovibrio nigricans DSM 22720]